MLTPLGPNFGFNRQNRVQCVHSVIITNRRVRDKITFQWSGVGDKGSFGKRPWCTESTKGNNEPDLTRGGWVSVGSCL